MAHYDWLYNRFFVLGFCFCKTDVSSRNVKKFIALNIVQLWQNCTATNWVCVYSIKFLSCSTMQHVHFVCQLSAASRLLELTQQPHSYLIETVRQRDAQISTLKERVSSLEDDVRYVDTIGVLKYESLSQTSLPTSLTIMPYVQHNW